MATGTGKTYTAFQIIWRLWKAGRKKRILFLADRNVLVDQTMVNDFRPFGAAMAKLSTSSKTIEREDGTEVQLPTAVDKKHRRIDTSYEIYLALYQAITGPEERQKLFRELSPDFFDLIVVDECHRGSAAEDSAWREILDYFSSATQIGLTATPKETEYVSNIHYFGKPVYVYSLKEGIRDGFLAPYKVVKVHLDVDVEGYRPARGETDKYGYEIEDRIYNQKDFDRNLVIDERTKRVARKVSEFLKESGDRFQKTIVFCVDTEHAARMRQALVNENPDLVQQNQRYVMRITGDDAEGRAQLGNFIDPEAKYPVIVTTSRLLSTGVDAQTCRLIVLDREVGSMTEFKQIVGRGTRVHEDTQKYYFTLIDFRKATNHFADPDFDGEPVQIYEPGEDDPVTPPDDVPPPSDGEDPVPPEPGEDEEVIVDPEQPDITITAGEPTRRGNTTSREGPSASWRSASNTSTRTASWSPRAFATIRSEPSASSSPASMCSSSAGTRRPEAGHHRRARSRRPAAGTLGRRGGQGPRPVRPDLPRRVRPAAAHPARAGRQCAQARRVHQVRRPGPRRARSAASEVSG